MRMVVAVAALGAALAGCGSAAKTITTTVPAGPTTATQAPSATAPSTPSPTSTIGDSSFQLPSTNIGCVIAAGTARCDIRARSWTPPSRPGTCPPEVDFGQGLTVGAAGPGTFVCAGDTALDPSAPTLAYGTASHVGDFTCLSEMSGVTCRNDSTGHGFTLSRQAYRLF